MERVKFSNISILSDTGCGISTVVSNGNTIKGLEIKNVTYNGMLIQNTSQWLVSGDNIEIEY
jgi:hypothetical protein